MNKIATFLLLAVFTLTSCSHSSKKKKEEAARTKELAKQEAPDQNFNAFIGRLRKAVEAHDAQTIASMMTPDFAFVMGATADQDKKGEGVFQYWDENGLWPELAGIVSENFVKKDDFMVAPPQFAYLTSEYDGYRAGIHRVNGGWKFVYFVSSGSTSTSDAALVSSLR